MTLEQTVGNREVKSRLIAMHDSGTVSHAYIFSGKKGVGKTTAAKSFAALLTGGSQADIIEVTNEKYNIKKATSALSVEAVRAARTEMFIKPYSAEKKVFLFPEAELLNPTCQNALLKVFEEPPGYCVIILVAQNESTLLQTIRSRAVTMRFLPLSDAEIREYLTAKGVKPDEMLVKLSEGSLAAADRLVNDENTMRLVKAFLPLAQKLDSPSAKDIYTIINFFDKEKADVSLLFDVLTVLFRETLLKIGEKCDTMAFKSIAPGVAAKVLDLLEQSRRALFGNANFNMVVSELFLNILEVVND